MYPACGSMATGSRRPSSSRQCITATTGEHRPIRVYENVNTRFIHEDFFAKLAQWARRNNRS